MKRVSKSQGGFKWSREKLLSYLGGDEGDLNILKIELTDLLLEHDKMYTSCRTKDGRAQQKIFILAHIIKLKPYVQDCNLRRLEGLMGLARVVKRSYKAGERYRSVTVRMSQIPQKEGEENDGTEGGPKDKIVIVTNIPTEPRPEPEPEEPGQARSVDDAKTLFLNCNIETVHANEDMVSTDAIGHENSVVVAPRSDVEMVSSTTLDTINPNHERFPNTVEEKPSPNDADMASTATTFDTPGPVGSGHDDFFSTVREQILPNDVDMLSAIDNRDSVEPSHENVIDTAEEQTLPNVLDILFASRTFNTRDPVEPSHEEFIDTAEEQTLHNDVEMVFTPTPTPTPDTSKPIQPNQLSQPIEPKPQIPQIVVKARNLLAKRQVPTHHFSDFGLNSSPATSGL
ncbi:hypothetical protein ASPCADRAFT_506191 [Aspergillus carbonarius ITEM 5010]|uniref:Uncharacterized protein n=1 Tax=Aspergillus carbonarius (strain ITEM 5010) TaxID=602072 RepID=A0A1R3RPZ4_ASPC5|nr:hypothetical protein ASPCADRAFT_506191 [Aspergillus carbonarius ITEM 5010]